MIELEEYRLRLAGLADPLAELREALDIDRCSEEIAALQEESAKDGFWDDLSASQKVLQKIKQLQSRVSVYLAEQS